MTQHCQPLPRDVAQQMLEIAARSLCDRPGETQPQCESRTRQMIHTVLGMEPRDGLELMLAITIFGQFTMLLDSMKDVLLGQEDSLKARTKSGIVALNRSLIGLFGEYRRARTRPAANQAEPVQVPDAEAAAASPAPDDAEPLPWTEEDEARFRDQVAEFQATVLRKVDDLAAARAGDADQPDAGIPPSGDALQGLMSGFAAAMAAQGVNAARGAGHPFGPAA